MRRATLAVGVAGLLVGALAAAGLAAVAVVGVSPRRSHTEETSFYMSVGLSTSGRPSLPQNIVETRVSVIVPEHYGDLFQITQDGKNSILWYRASDGSISNAIVTNSSSVPYQIIRRPTDRIVVTDR